MRWKISIEGSDEITRGHRFEFEIEKSLDDLAAGSLGLSIKEGKAVMASLQRHIVEQQCAFYVLFRRHCQGCGGTRPIKDYSTRTIQTVYGAVTVESPRLYPCRRCMPGVDFTITPVSKICPDRATAELMTLTAKLGAVMPYRAAAEVLADFLPGQTPTRHTTLRHRTLAIGKRLEEKEEQRMFFEQVDKQERRQRELPLPGDPEREFVLSIDTAHIPQIRGRETRSFEAVICHASRGGVGSDRGVLFAFSGTSRRRMRAEGLLALKRLGYEGKGDITVISDGEECLKRLKSVLPQPAKQFLDWFHIAMKLRPIEQTSKWLARRLPPDEQEEFLEDIAAVRWRLWNGQTERAIDLIDRLFHDLKADEQGSTAIVSLRGGLLNLRIYVEQNRSSITNYGARYREGRRIASTAAEASVNNLVARRMVKKQQMRWSERGANLLLQVRVALANGDLAERLAYQPPIQPGQTLISPFVPVPLFQRAA
jgi:hypothetical protein